MNKQNILPSIFAAPVTSLHKAIETISDSSVELVHYDIMDNHFVPNISFGYGFTKQVMQAIPNCSADIHLMTELPGHWETFLSLTPSSLTIHAEAGDDTMIISILKEIKSTGVLAGIAIKPSTAVHTIEQFIPYADLLLIMSVNPGFSFQSFIPESYQKIKQARKLYGQEIIIEVDGGINRNNMIDLQRFGANWLVMGGGFFNDPYPTSLIHSLIKN